MRDGRKNILITGGLGFIGWNLVRGLLKTGEFNINVLDKKMISNPETFRNQDIKIFSGTPTSALDDDVRVNALQFIMDDTKASRRADVVVHLGEFARVEQSLRGNLFEVLESNVVGTARLLQSYARYCPDAIFMYAGSSTRFSWGLAYEQSPYAFTKYTNAELVKLMRKWFGYRTFVTYFYNVFGEGENDDYLDGTVVGKFVKYWEEKEKIVVNGGSQTRRFTYIGDVVRNYIELINLLLERKDMPTSFHMVSPSIKETSINELAKMFYDDDMIIWRPERSGCRSRSVEDTVLQNVPTFGTYNTRIEDYINTIKAIKV